MSKLIGFKRFESKKGEMYCVANVMEPYSKRNISNGCLGSKCSEVFMPDDFYDFLKESDIGHEITFDYEISGNKAYIVDVSIK